MICAMTRSIDFEAGEMFVPEWSIGDRLRKIRRVAKLTQGEFASRLDVKEPTYNAWETGRNIPSYDEALRIAKRIRLMCSIPEWWTLGLERPNPRPIDPDGGRTSRLGESNPRPFHYKSAIRPISLDTHRSRHTAASPARRAS